MEIVRRPLGELLRKSGRSPFSLRLVDIEWLCAHTQGREEATGKAFLLLLAAVARVRRQGPIGQANLRPRFSRTPGRVTRREMFS
ncbi:MAG: hypothetical protein Q8O76_08085, partial [Chloroflexota bacterium]|nr:hypothetical protein [Chloroflexota bacterium]